MPKLSLLIFQAAVLAAALQITALAAPAGTRQTIQTGPPFLKINGYFVLYLHPAAPYRDARGMLVAPVKHLAALLGADAKTSPDGNTITLSKNGQTVVFTVGRAPQADVKPGYYSLPTRWHGTGEIVAPVERLAFGLGIRAEWDPKHQVFQMHSGDALADQEDNIHGFPFPDFVPNADILPVSFRLTMARRPSGDNEKGLETEYPYRCRIVLRNESARTITDDGVVDVIEEHASDTRGDSIGKPGSRQNGSYGVPTQPLIRVRPGRTYRLSTAGSAFHPLEAVLVAGGSRTPNGH